MKTSMKNRLAVNGLVIAFILMASSGCSQWESKDAPWPWQKEEAVPVPDRILAVWTDTIQHTRGKQSLRGFGGRIFFYGNDPQPIKVEGDVTIYVFDDADPESVAAKKKFIFDAETLEKHYSQSHLGHSYSFWVPWGPIDGPPMKLSLITRFDGTNGGAAISPESKKLLPGTQPDLALKAKGASGVQQVSYDEIESKRDPIIKSHTIEIPPSFAQRLRQIVETTPTTQEANQQKIADLAEQLKRSNLRLENEIEDRANGLDQNGKLKSAAGAELETDFRGHSQSQFNPPSKLKLNADSTAANSANRFAERQLDSQTSEEQPNSKVEPAIHFQPLTRRAQREPTFQSGVSADRTRRSLSGSRFGPAKLKRWNGSSANPSDQ